MSGHSKWSQIKRQKGANDQKRGALFTKLAREITIAARIGGGDPDANFRLRLAIQRARDNNLPADNIQRAIQKAVGGGDAAELQEITYEGYGPGGVAVMVEAMTDNRNRTVGDLRAVFSRAGGNLGESGSVAWQFESRGVISVPAADADVDAISETAIEAGADDLIQEAENIEVYTAPADLETVRTALTDAGYEVASAELSLVAKTPVTLERKDAEQLMRLLDKLEDLDDVQRVYSNAEFTDDILAAISA